MEFSTRRPIVPAELRPLFAQTDWADERTEEGIAHLLAVTPLVIGAWDGDRLIGFARALGDGRFRALIEDVVVAAEYRRRGIGRRLVEGLLAELRGVDIVLLFADDDVAPFYTGLGFDRHEEQSCYRRANP